MVTRREAVVTSHVPERSDNSFESTDLLAEQAQFASFVLPSDTEMEEGRQTGEAADLVDQCEECDQNGDTQRNGSQDSNGNFFGNAMVTPISPSDVTSFRAQR